MDTTSTTPLQPWTEEGAGAFLSALAETTAPMAGPTARSVRSYAKRYLAYCEEANRDPLTPDASTWSNLAAALGERQRWKLAHAVRSVLEAAGRPASSQPMGIGDQSWRTRRDVSPRLAQIVDRTIAIGGERAPIWRSALGRLLAFCAEQGWDPLDAAAVDLDDYELWLRAFGTSHGEQLQVARTFVALKDELPFHTPRRSGTTGSSRKASGQRQRRRCPN